MKNGGAHMKSQIVTADGTAVITVTDFDRLRRLLDSPRYRATQSVPLRSLEGELALGELVSAEDVPKDVVTMRSVVCVRDLVDRGSETYTLVYPDEAAIAEGRLSVLAPMGRALLGARVGQVIEFKAPAGLRRLKVVKILYQPEAAGDFHL
jgi:regulator of nucleoside diphosphate kinase